MTEFETKDSGERQQWESGMQRDVQTGKPRFALMWTKRQPYEDQMVTRYARLLARGAEKYEDRNWEEGCGQAELDYAMESLGRHTAQLICGETDEDHAAGVWFNTQLIEYIRWRMAQDKPKGGVVPKSPILRESSPSQVSEDGKHVTMRLIPGPPATRGELALARELLVDKEPRELLEVGTPVWIKRGALGQAQSLRGQIDSAMPGSADDGGDQYLVVISDPWPRTFETVDVRDLSVRN